jgi:hypothetical protein
MTIGAELDALRNSFSGCSLVAFGDSRTRLMLRSSHEQACHREHLDELCAQAANCFDLLDFASHDDHSSDDDNVRPCEAIVLTANNMRAFVRAEGGGSDFICCVYDSPHVKIDIVTAAQEALNKIAVGYL